MLRKKLSMPIVVVLLDFVGILFIGFGLHIQFSGGSALVPPALQSEQLPVALIVFGALLMLPMIGYILKSAGRSARNKPPGID